MGMSEIVAKGVAIVGGAAIMMRRFGATTDKPAFGPEAEVPEAKAQGIMTLKMPTAQGFAPGKTPDAASGLKVNAFATGPSRRAAARARMSLPDDAQAHRHRAS